MGGILNKPGATRISWSLIMTYALAAIGGLVLVLGFYRFNALHQQFLSANFDSVHGARTLLKARLLIELSARELDTAVQQPAQTSAILHAAEKKLRNAEHYAAEGKDGHQTARNTLVERIGAARGELTRLQRGTPSDAPAPAFHAAAQNLLRLAQDIDAAELDSWGTLSGLNKELEGRMRTMNQLLSATLFLFVGIMLVLAWALLRTRRAEADVLAAKHSVEAIQQTTLDASPIGIAIIDTTDLDNRRIQASNRQMADIFGYDPETMPGLGVRRLFAGLETYQRLCDDALQRLGSGEVMREEVVMQKRNGMPFWCALSIKAIDPDHIAHGVVWTCEDIGERKAAEVELQQERARAESASRAKSDFLANMSHELRTPFTGLFGLIDLLGQSRLDATQRRHLELARSSARQMQSIVTDILDFSKIEAGKLIIERVPFRLRELITAIAATHATAAQHKGLQFSLDFVEPASDLLRGDPVRIRQIVDNLLSNAVKFTERGEIRLTVQSQFVGNGTANVRITVEDSGVGIPAEMQAHIFDKFTQADSSTTRLYGGTGLGLAICKQLTTLMEGQISLSSGEGKGSRFVLQLALPQAGIDEFKQFERPGVQAPGERIDGVVIVLADDNALNLGMMAETLELFGAVVWPARNGEEAIRLVQEHHPDIVLMDCQMPGMDGFEATRRIRAAESAGKHLPIIAITAFATSTHHDLCLAPGMMDRFMSKPIDMPELIASIHDLVAGPSDPSAATRSERPPLSGSILLVDDNPPILESTRAMLSRFGCEVTTATDGTQALRILEASAAGRQRDFDLVLMDCQMPLLDGRSTCRRWREYERSNQLTPLAIIAVTADEQPETLLSCREAGMDGTLVKPFSETEMHDLLSEWLG